MTVRGKIFIAMGVLVMLVTAAYIGTTQGYLGSLFARYVPEGSGGGLGGDHLEELSKYVLGEMKMKALMVTLFVACAVVILGYWLSGLIIHPLHKLIAVMRKVADGDLTTEVPIKRKDEYGQVGEAFNSMTHQLREAMDLRKRLVEDIAHELRTPLSIVQSKLELIQQSPTDVKPEVLLPLHDEVLRLVHLVDELHLLNTAEAGQLVLHKEKTDLNLLLGNLMELIEPEADACGVTLKEPEYRDSAWARVDPKRLKQVLLNLLTNALRHTPEGGSISVRIDARDLSGQVAISITDTGTGIPADALPHVFDRFYRVDSGRGRSTGGTGLGLSIAKQIAAAHGGYIQVQSELGKGTEFTVILPWSHDSSKN